MTPSDKSNQGNHFSSFTVGMVFGVAAALLFGTEEGRKLVKKVINAIPDKYKTPPVNLGRPVQKVPLIPTEETPHHVAFDHEAPPPPAPAIKPSLAEPFHPKS